MNLRDRLSKMEKSPVALGGKRLGSNSLEFRQLNKKSSINVPFSPISNNSPAKISLKSLKNNANRGSTHSINELISKEKLRKFKALRRISVNQRKNNKRGDVYTSSLGGNGPLIQASSLFDTQDDFLNDRAYRSFCIIHPDTVIKIIWDVFGMFFIIYQSVMVPFRISFNFTSIGFLSYLETCQDFYFMADILFTLNTGFYNNGLIILKRSDIVINYLKFWFWVDMLASFPYSMVVSFSAYFSFENTDSQNLQAVNLLRLLKFMRLMRLLRVLRMFKLKRFLRFFEEIVFSDGISMFLHILKIFSIFLFIAHLGACFWFFIGINELNSDGYSWITNAQIIDASIYVQYVFSLYYYIFTMTTIGYGGIVPVTSLEKLYAMFNMILACGVSAYIIGSMGNIISSRYDAETNFKSKMDNMNQFLIQRKITKQLRQKIKKYLEHVLENKKENKIDETEVLQLLNRNLREEISLHLNGQILKGFHILCKYEEFCILLTYVMKEETMNPNEIIFEKGQESNRIYFLTKGKVNICEHETKIIFKELIKGCFGEIGFFSRRPRICSAESVNFINLTYFTLNEFKDFASRYRVSNDLKFKMFKDEIEGILTEIRQNNFQAVHVTCYMCESSDHLAPSCNKLENIDEFYKLKFVDKRHRTENELETIYKLLQTNKENDILAVENQIEFSFSDEDENFFNDSRFDYEEDWEFNIGEEEENEPIFDESGEQQTNSNLMNNAKVNPRITSIPSKIIGIGNIKRFANLEHIQEISRSHVESDLETSKVIEPIGNVRKYPYSNLRKDSNEKTNENKLLFEN